MPNEAVEKFGFDRHFFAPLNCFLRRSLYDHNYESS